MEPNRSGWQTNDCGLLLDPGWRSSCQAVCKMHTRRKTECFPIPILTAIPVPSSYPFYLSRAWPGWETQHADDGHARATVVLSIEQGRPSHGCTPAPHHTTYSFKHMAHLHSTLHLMLDKLWGVASCMLQCCLVTAARPPTGQPPRPPDQPAHPCADGPEREEKGHAHLRALTTVTEETPSTTKQPGKLHTLLVAPVILGLGSAF